LVCEGFSCCIEESEGGVAVVFYEALSLQD
jgi:hypothetical protein